MASVPALHSRSTPGAGDSNEHIQTQNEHYDNNNHGNEKYSHQGELSDEELEHLRVKSKPKVEEHETPEVESEDEGNVVDIPKEKDDKEETENTRSNSEIDETVGEDPVETEDKGSNIDEGTKQTFQEEELVSEEGKLP